MGRLTLLASILASMAAWPVEAAPSDLHVPSLPLVRALERLSAATGLSIGGTAAVRPGVRSRAVRGARTPAEALRRMLEGTGLSALRIDERTFRIVTAASPPRPRSNRTEAAGVEAPPVQDIVVVGSKLPLPLARSDANVEVVTFDTPLRIADARGASTDLRSSLPALSGTWQGRGRDKLFLRGVADSSFVAGSQSTLGAYLGEARINYDAPDPGLLLYDVRQVELLKGPQGTLYGGGTMGGVLRIEPERPKLDVVEGFADSSASTTRRGEPGYAFAAAGNVPVIGDRVAVRFLGYRRRDGGYVDDLGRGSKDVNRVTVDGLRGQLRWQVDDWTADVLAVHQRIASRDSNYSVEGLPPLTRSSGAAQPSANRFDLFDFELRGKLADLDILSTASVSGNRVSATYDFPVRASAPGVVVERRHIRNLNGETRMSSPASDGFGWVAGLSLFAQTDVSTRDARIVQPMDLDSGFDARRFEAGAFGQARLRRGPWSLTAGIRGSYSEARSTAASPVRGTPRTGTDHLRASPTIELALDRGRSIASLSYRESWRPGGATITRFLYEAPGAPTGSYLVPYGPDHIRVAALGYSYRRGGQRPVTIQATLSGYDWDRIQTASIDRDGVVSIAGGDNANLVNLDLVADWQPAAGIALKGGASFTRAFVDSFFDDDDDDFFGGRGVVPSVPDVVAFGSMVWTGRVAGTTDLGIEGRLSYVGRSRLGLSGGDTRRQGGVVDSRIAIRLSRGRYGASLEVENVADDRSSVFAFGNPFTFRTERQLTPLRPRTAIVGLHASF